MNTNLKHVIKMSLLTVLMANISTAANAQLGGLLNKAKKVATGVLEGKSTGQIASDVAADAQQGAYTSEQLKKRRAERAELEKKAQDETGQTGKLPEAKRGDVNFYYATGRRMGIWHSSTKTWEKFGKDAAGNWASATYTFKSDGQVVYQDGLLKGIINKDGTMRSVNTEDIRVYDEGYVSWKGEQIGYINQYGDIWFMDDIMAYSEEPVDKSVACYIFYCNIIDTEYIEEWKPKYEAAKEQRAIDRIKKHGPVTFGGGGSSSGGGGGQLSADDRWTLSGGWLSLNNERKVKIESNGNGWTIRDQNNAYVADVHSDGTVISTSRGNLGSISSDGRCVQAGGGFTYSMDSNGTLRLNGANMGMLTTGYSVPAAAYIFLIYAPR